MRAQKIMGTVVIFNDIYPKPAKIKKHDIKMVSNSVPI